MSRYAEMWPKYAAWWNQMAYRPGREAEFVNYAHFAVDHKQRYVDVDTTVPWYLIALLHRRESDANFDTYLGNGQSLHHVTTIVPRGRGPFASFEAGARDALRVDGLTSVLDWRLEKIFYYCELFNGLGYAMRGIPSPYIWGGTTIQHPGKYVGDGQWNGNAWDGQPGCAPILKAMMLLDSTIAPERET
jgi:lysozyme family protein